MSTSNYRYRYCTVLLGELGTGLPVHIQYRVYCKLGFNLVWSYQRSMYRYYGGTSSLLTHSNDLVKLLHMLL
jgi:hypothetical protein